MTVFKEGTDVKGFVMVGRLFMGPGVYHEIWPGIEACDDALKSLKRTLSGKEPPTPQELERRYQEKRKRMLRGLP